MNELPSQIDVMELSGANYSARMEDGILVPIIGTPIEATRRAALKIAFLKTDYVRYEDNGQVIQVGFSQARLEFTEDQLNAYIDSKYQEREQYIQEIIERVIRSRDESDFEEQDDLDAAQEQGLDDLVRVQHEIDREIAFGRHIRGQYFRKPQPSPV